MSLGHRPHQRRLTAHRLLRIRVAAIRQQQGHHRDVAAARRRQDGTLAPRIRVGAGLQQPLDHRDAGIEDATPSGVTPPSSAAFTFAPARMSRSCEGHIVAMRRPVKRRRPVGLEGH